MIRIIVLLNLKFSHQIAVCDEKDHSYQVVAEIPIPEGVEMLVDMAAKRTKELYPDEELKIQRGFLFLSCFDPKTICQN